MGKKNWALLLVVASALTPISAYALPGEADAVVRHCGQPTGSSQETSQVTGEMQRTLIYNDVMLHFQPMEGGWSFTTGWHRHLPISRGKLETVMPCFRDAMAEVAAAPQQAIDPTTATQSTVPQVSATTFGPSFLWLIGGLVFAIILFIAVPARRRKKMRKDMVLEDRPYRRPKIAQLRFLRRKRVVPTATEL